MPALIDAGVTKEQLLAVWSLDGATGFTPAQLKEASITVAEMQSAGLTVSEMYTGGVSVADLRMAEVSIADLRSAGVSTHELHSGGFTIDQMQSAGLTILQIHAGGVSVSDLLSAMISVADLYHAGVSVPELYSGGVTIPDLRSAGIADDLVFNEACNTPQTTGTQLPMITLTGLNNMKTRIVLEGKATDSTRWMLSGFDGLAQFIRIRNSPGMISNNLGNTIAEYLRDEGSTVVSTLSILFADVFDNRTLTLGDNSANEVSIDLCPCASDDPPDSAMCP